MYKYCKFYLVFLIIAYVLTACDGKEKGQGIGPNQVVLDNGEVVDFEMSECDSFIKLGIKYIFNDAGIIDISTEPIIEKGYGHAEAVFSKNSVTIKVGSISETYQILESSYEELIGTDFKTADFILSRNNLKCNAHLWIGDKNAVASQGFIIEYPQEAVEKYYQNKEESIKRNFPMSHYIMKLMDK